MKITIGHTTHPGIKRDHNEDTYGVNSPKHIFLVADGMGGHDHGEIASALARDNIMMGLKNGMDTEQAILSANQEIINSSLEKPGDLPMGTTIVIVQLDNNQKYQCTWVGDSRAYVYQNKSLQAISSDHSYVQELVDQKLISAEQARSHPHRNVVTQALGVTDNSEIKIAKQNGSFQSGDKFLLCSDGLTEEVDDACIESIMSQNNHPKELADQLLVKALENGGSDNITVLVLGID